MLFDIDFSLPLNWCYLLLIKIYNLSLYHNILQFEAWPTILLERYGTGGVGKSSLVQSGEWQKRFENHCPRMNLLALGQPVNCRASTQPPDHAGAAKAAVGDPALAWGNGGGHSVWRPGTPTAEPPLLVLPIADWGGHDRQLEETTWASSGILGLGPVISSPWGPGARVQEGHKLLCFPNHMHLMDSGGERCHCVLKRTCKQKLLGF